MVYSSIQGQVRERNQTVYNEETISGGIITACILHD